MMRMNLKKINREEGYLEKCGNDFSFLDFALKVKFAECSVKNSEIEQILEFIEKEIGS